MSLDIAGFKGRPGSARHHFWTAGVRVSLWLVYPVSTSKRPDIARFSDGAKDWANYFNHITERGYDRDDRKSPFLVPEPVWEDNGMR